MAELDDLLRDYHLQYLDSVVRTRESAKNNYVCEKCYKVHVYVVCLYFGEKILVVLTMMYLYGV